MRLAEPYFEWWQRMIQPPEPTPQETPALSAWEAGKAFARVVNTFNQARRQHRKSRHQRRR